MGAVVYKRGLIERAAGLLAFVSQSESMDATHRHDAEQQLDGLGLAAPELAACREQASKMSLHQVVAELSASL